MAITSIWPQEILASWRIFLNDINLRTQQEAKCIDLDILDLESHEAFLCRSR